MEKSKNDTDPERTQQDRDDQLDRMEGTVNRIEDKLDDSIAGDEIETADD